MSLTTNELKARIQHYLDTLDEAARRSTSVCAVVEMGLLSETERSALGESFQGHPWLRQSRFSALRPLGPWLFDTNIETLLAELYPMAERGFHGVLVTHQPVAEEAEKLGEFCVVKGDDGEEQLLRYYAPHVLPIVHRFQDEHWYHSLFGSIRYWWLPELEGWQEYDCQENQDTGSAQADASAAHETITLTPALLQALGSDPLAHQILGELERTSPGLFTVACPGIRLAMVDKALGEARDAGFESLQDLSVYTAYCVAYGFEVTQQNDFQQAVALSLSTSRALADTLKPAGSHSKREGTNG